MRPPKSGAWTPGNREPCVHERARDLPVMPPVAATSVPQWTPRVSLNAATQRRLPNPVQQPPMGSTTASESSRGDSHWCWSRWTSPAHTARCRATSHSSARHCRDDRRPHAHSSAKLPPRNRFRTISFWPVSVTTASAPYCPTAPRSLGRCPTRALPLRVTTERSHRARKPSHRTTGRPQPAYAIRIMLSRWVSATTCWRGKLGWPPSRTVGHRTHAKPAPPR